MSHLQISVGRYCEWEHINIDRWNNSETFEDYTKTLRLACDETNEPAIYNWTVPYDAPDLLFYQVNESNIQTNIY